MPKNEPRRVEPSQPKLASAFGFNPSTKTRLAFLDNRTLRAGPPTSGRVPPLSGGAHFDKMAAERAESSTLIRASAAEKACSACHTAAITTLLSSAEPVTGMQSRLAAVPAARNMSSAVMRRSSRATS